MRQRVRTSGRLRGTMYSECAAQQAACICLLRKIGCTCLGTQFSSRHLGVTLYADACRLAAYKNASVACEPSRYRLGWLAMLACGASISVLTCGAAGVTATVSPCGATQPCSRSSASRAPSLSSCRTQGWQPTLQGAHLGEAAGETGSACQGGSIHDTRPPWVGCWCNT